MSAAQDLTSTAGSAGPSQSQPQAAAQADPVGTIPSQTVSAPEFAPSQIRRNMTAVILLDSIYSTGWAELFLALGPLWVFLEASNRTIGLISAAGMMGLLGMFLSPWISRRFHAKKWYLFITHIPYLLPIGLAGLGVLFSERLGFSSPTLLLFVAGMIVVHQFFGGFVNLPHQEYIAACIPMSHRGRYTGLSGSIGSATAMAATAVGGVMLLRMPKPMCFGVLMLLTWGICQGGYLIALLAKESPVPVMGTPKPWSRGMLSAVWHNKAFVRVLLIRAIGQLTFLPAAGFIMYYGLKDLKMAAACVATGAMMGQIIRICTSAPSGWLIDRLGAKRVLPLAAIGSAIGYAIALLIPPDWQIRFPAFLGGVLISGPAAIYVSGVLRTALVTSTWSAGGILLYGLPRPEHRAGHYTIQLLVEVACGSIGVALAGVMYDLIPYRTGFWIMLAWSLLMFPVMKWLLSPLSDDAKAYS